MATVPYVIAAYVAVLVCISAFAIYALVAAYLENRKHKDGIELEEFITAKGSVNKWYIAYSFYAGAMGSWVIVGPASYAAYSGLLGLFFYSVSAGFPILFIAYFGAKITAQLPSVLSFTDYIHFRFGRAGQVLMTVCVLFSMSIGLLAEYVTIGALFRDYVGSVAWGIIVVQGLLTMTYTAYGGLKVSILTDRVQTIVAISLTMVLAVYLAVTFRHDLPTPLTADQKGFNFFGFSSIVSMPISLLAATICSESMWQRAWASESKEALYFGAWVGSIATTIVVFFFGFCGFLAIWAGLVDLETANPNLYLFSLFSTTGDGRLDTWTGVITLTCAAIMSESSIDTVQNGINATLSATFLKGRPVIWSRIMVLVVNIPLMIVASLGLVDNVLSLFLVANMLVTCLFLPVLAGFLLDPFKRYISASALFLGSFTAFFSISLYGISVQNWKFGEGLVYTWYGNGYDWHFFVIGPTTSVLGILAGMGCQAIWDKFHYISNKGDTIVVSANEGTQIKAPKSP